MKKTLLWLVAIPLIAIGSLTYANDFIVPDTENGTITVYSQDYSYWITIQDKNLWAENVWDTWYYFQWWNNHGNSWDSSTVSTLLSTDDLSNWANKWYSGNVPQFIQAANSYGDYRSGLTNYNETGAIQHSLWWGSWDNDNIEGIVKWYDTVNHVATNVTWRQWPCPEWYHVPSAWEWQELMMLWCNANSDICSWNVIQTPTRYNGECNWANYLSSNGIWTAFSNDLKLPLAGYRDYYDGDVYGQGYTTYWSSSPRGGSNPESAWRLYFGPGYVDPSYDGGLRAYGQSVRCFKDSYVKLPKTLNLFFISEDVEVWTWEVTENMTGAVPEEAKNLSRTWYELFWIRSGADTSTGFDFENTPISWDWADENDNVYFIAQWTPITYTVEFTWTDVEWIMNPQTFTYGVTWTLNRNAFTKNWYTFSIWTDWTTWYTDGQEVVNLTTTSGDVITLTAEWTKIETKPSWGSSGGGGRKNKTSDTQDSSTSSQNDKKTENVIQSETKWSEESSNIPMDSLEKSSEWQTYTQEFQEAYEFAKEKWITTMPTINDANMNWKLTRIAMAKMLSYYAINVLWQKPDEIRNNKFNDITDKLDAQYDSGITLAYQLWIMWINMPNNNFRPNDEVTRAEFATALSRMLYSTPDGKPYYATHLQKLKAEWILKNDDYKMKELRGYVMIMLKRSAK